MMFIHMILSKKFDYILLIGVLEYVGINSEFEQPYHTLLKRIHELLKPTGKLLLAIENRFGLKYWCGAAEDHTGISFDGISGYKNNSYTTRYNKSGVCTFSKDELNVFLRHVGLKMQDGIIRCQIINFLWQFFLMNICLLKVI